MNRDSNSPVGAIVAGVGGALLAIGSLMTWAKVTFDVNAFAQALGIDPSLLADAPGLPTSQSFAGTSGSDGKIALVCGLVAIVAAVVAFAKRDKWKPLGIVSVLAGLAGGGLATYDIAQKGKVLADAKAEAGPSLAAAGIDPAVLDNVFNVSLGIGIWMCAIGGVIVILGGFLLITRRSSATAPATVGVPVGSSVAVPPPPADPSQGATGTGTPSEQGGTSPS